MTKKIGFIGCGKMAQAMIGGMIESKEVSPEHILASARTDETLKEAEAKFGIRTTMDNKSLAEQSDYLFLAIAPGDHTAVIEEIREAIKPKAIIITIAAGITMKDVEDAFQSPVKVVRTMPNTPSLIKEGMTAVCANVLVEKEELDEVTALFKSFGEVEVIKENQMDAIPAISGASPAYVYILIEALADGGVRDGLTRRQAYRLAAQAVRGAAEMVLETEKHPGELKDQVTSPGGATIEAVAELEEKQFRGAVLSAMSKCTDKVKKLR